MTDVLYRLQYASPLVALLVMKASALRRQLQAGQVKSASSSAAVSSAKAVAIGNSLKILSSKISDARMLGRFFGLLPIIAWLFSLEQKSEGAEQAPATLQSRIVKNVQRVQAWSMMAYYPLEHACELLPGLPSLIAIL